MRIPIKGKVPDSFRQIVTFPAGGEKRDPDIIAFSYASIFAFLMVIAAFFGSRIAWTNQQEILFALPIFPTMESCAGVEEYQKSPHLPLTATDPAILTLYIPTNVEPSSKEMEIAIQEMVLECNYNRDLFLSYENLRKFINQVPNENEGASPEKYNPDVLHPESFIYTLEGLLKIFFPIVCLLGILALFVIGKQAKKELLPAKNELDKAHENLKKHENAATKLAYLHAEEKYKAVQDIYKKFNTVSIENILLVVILAGLSIFGLEVVWFFIERALSQPLIYGIGTSILFISLLVGVFSFLYISWIMRLEITDLSIFTSLLLLSGLMVGMLLTNHVWDVGITNAYSTMSEHAYPERLAYEVAGARGSRNVFTSTFLASGLLFGVYSIYLWRKVRLVKEVVGKNNSDHSILMTPIGVLSLGILSALLMTMVGFFPTDGVRYVVPVVGWVWDFDAQSSGLLHKIGAFGSPLIILLMILSFWFIGYPKGQKKDWFLPISSYVWFAITAIAMMMYVVGNVVNSLNGESWMILFDGNLQNPLAEHRQNLMGLPTYLLIAVYAINWYRTRQWRWVFSKDYLPFVFALLTVILGGVLGVAFSKRMTTVSLEFIILLVFALFVYSYSKYLVEYEAEKTDDKDAKEAQATAASPVEEAVEKVPPIDPSN